MTFFNRKEEVIDIELTQYGKLLLAKGKFKPKKYAFFDDDVIYDAQYMNPTDPTSVSNPIAENQNDASTRIKESVRGHAQHNYGDAYNLGEAEEGEESFLMSVGTQNVIGTKIVTTDVSPADIVYTYDIEDYYYTFFKKYGYYPKDDFMASVQNIFEAIKSNASQKEEVLFETVTPGKTYRIIKRYIGPRQINNKLYPVYETNFETMNFGGGRYVFDHDIYYEGIPLGSMELKNQKLPAWNILSLNDKEMNLISLTLDLMAVPPGKKPLDDFSTKFYTYGDLPIPQISTNIKVRTLLDDNKTINILEEDIVETQQMIDGLTLRVKNDYLLLVIDEKNTYFENENFSIEVFEMEDNTSPASATFVVSTVGSISNGQTLKFAAFDGTLYSAVINTSITKENSTATKIGTSGVSTNAQLAESINRSISDFSPGIVKSSFDQIGATGNYRITIDQAQFIEATTKDTAIQGTLITAGVLTSLVNWDMNPASKLLKRLYFSEDSTNKGSGMLYSPSDDIEISSTPINDSHVGYYMNVLVDEEIDSQLFRKYQDKLKNIRVDKLLKPEGQTNFNSFNIYGDDTEDPGSIC